MEFRLLDIFFGDEAAVLSASKGLRRLRREAEG
jgi:hypothetical protein